jgi:hypothetical protein
MDAFVLALLTTGTNLTGFLLLARSNQNTINRLFQINKQAAESAEGSAVQRIIVLETELGALKTEIHHQRTTIHDLMFMLTNHSRNILQGDT